jgi:hypothetical protein
MRKKQLKMFVQDERELERLKKNALEKFLKLDIHKTKIIVQFMRDNNMGKNKRTIH